MFIKFLLIVLVLNFCPDLNAQVKGTSQKGSLKFKKETPAPEIILADPPARNGEEISVSDRMIIVKGKIVHSAPLRSLRINNKIVATETDGAFSYQSALQPGVNNFLITAEDEQSKSASMVFYINCTFSAGPAPITIIEPALEGKNEIAVKEKSIVVRAKVNIEGGVKEVRINTQKARSIGKTEFYANLTLRDGSNLVTIKATGKKGAPAELSFKVIVESDLEGPQITILEPAVSRGITVVRKSETVPVKGTAIDKSGVHEVTINGIKADLQPDGTFSLTMFLNPGDNILAVKAVDNNLNESTETFHITRKLEDLLTGGRYYGLFIGINTYSGYWPPLKSALNDAKELASLLSSGYRFDSVITLLNEKATRKNILQQLEWLTNNLSKDDNLLIFYAGHGQFNKALNRGYWVPSDAVSNSIADYIPNSEVKTFLAGIPAKHILLITDACFGGDIFRGKTESYPFDPNDMEKYYREVYRRQSRLALTSGGVEEVRDDGKDGHSIFTYYLIKALTENQRKYIDAAQLYNELRIAVGNNSDQTPILQAVKDTYDEGGQFIFVKRDK